jgi:hypothetical protein
MVLDCEGRARSRGPIRIWLDRSLPLRENRYSFVDASSWLAIEGNSSMAKSSPGSVIGQKALGTLIMWSTVGLICVQVFFYVSFGPAV